MSKSFRSTPPSTKRNPKDKPPSEIHLEDFHLYKHSFSEVTVETND
jgi:hypothetical protein